MKKETFGLGGLLVTSFLLSLFSGSQQLGMVPFVEKLISGEQAAETIFWELRMPRTLACTFCGALLAWAGVCTQGLFRNPMAEPSLLGVNSGAMVFLLLSQLAGGYMPSLKNFTFLPAFGGAIFSLSVLWLFNRRGQASTLTLILLGICLNAFLGALITIAYLLLPAQVLKNLFFWSVGDCSMVQWKHVWPVLATLPVLIYFSKTHHRSLDILSMGEEEATLLGIEVRKVQQLVIVLIALSVSVCLNAIGNLGFLALLSPHLVRFWKGPNHHNLMIFSPLIGAIWLNLADYLSKSVLAGIQIPIGVFIILTGVPLFLWVVVRRGDFRLRATGS